MVAVLELIFALCSLELCYPAALCCFLSYHSVKYLYLVKGLWVLLQSPQ